VIPWCPILDSVTVDTSEQQASRPVRMSLSKALAGGLSGFMGQFFWRVGAGCLM
jgi:hypothetical protein